MGFHKRFISEDVLIGHYNSGGIQQVADLWRADAIITSDDVSSDVSDMLCSEYVTKEEGLEMAEFMILSTILNKQEHEKKKKTITTG